MSAREPELPHLDNYELRPAAYEQEQQTLSKVPEWLHASANLYRQRNLQYGDSYKRFGPVMAALLPDGGTFKDPSDANRIGVLVQIVSKLTRYAANFSSGGHDDSLQDIAVYAMILRELDEDSRRRSNEDTHL